MILVTGATGNNGREIIRLLADHSIPVRGMVRDAKKTPQAPSRDVQFVTGNFDDAASMQEALAGIERAFLVTNSSENAQQQQLRFIEAARAAGVRHIVYLSQLHAALDSPVRFLRYHAAVEDALRSSGMAFTNLRPNLYMQGLLLFRPVIAARHKFFAPIGDARISVVDVRDIAAAATVALVEPGHEGKTYDLTGPEALTHTEMASRIAHALGKKVDFVEVSEQEMREALASWHVPEWQIEGVLEDYQHYRSGGGADVSTTIQDLTGRPPRDFTSFAENFREALRAAT